MSIETLIQAHTEALLANTEAVKLLTLSLTGRTPSKQKVDAEKIAEGIADAEAGNLVPLEDVKADHLAKAAGCKAKEEPKPEAVDEKDDVPDFGKITYETLRALVLKLASGGKREEIKSASAKHGLATPKDLIQDAKGNAIEPDQAKMEALYADLQAVED